MSTTLRLGRSTKRVDPRTLRYGALRDASPWNAPKSYSWDGEYPSAVPTPMFDNDRLGCCVISARAHQTLRFKYLEDSAPPPISDSEVENEYLSETGGADSGLVMLYAMRDWRNLGWRAGGRFDSIHSFYDISAQRHDEFKEALLVGTGVQVGVNLPLSAQDQLDAGLTWDLASGPRGSPGSWGGHAMLCVGYDEGGVEFITWGARQRATWAWLDHYCDECYLVIDAIERLADHHDLAVVEEALERAVA